MRSAKASAEVHVVLDHHDGDVARHLAEQLAHLARSSCDNPASGSSSSSTFGFCASAIAISSRRRSP
jgi:hypothetical protein